MIQIHSWMIHGNINVPDTLHPPSREGCSLCNKEESGDGHEIPCCMLSVPEHLIFCTFNFHHAQCNIKNIETEVWFEAFFTYSNQIKSKQILLFYLKKAELGNYFFNY